MNKHAVGVWSVRKDACEAVARTGAGEVAARVLGHREVNSRTMNRVYRADLRCKDLGAYAMGRTPEVQQMGAPLTCLSARRVAAAGGVRSFDDVPAGPEREAVAVSSKVAAAEVEKEDAARAIQARVGAAGVAVDIGSRGWKILALSHGAGAEVSRYEKAKLKKTQSVCDAQRVAQETYHLRVYKEGQLAHSKDKSLAVEMCVTHAWATRSENKAIAFGLERVDRTSELNALRKLPPILQGSILAVGALQVLPLGCSMTVASVFEHVVRRCDGLCSLRCGSAECEDAPEAPLPSTERAFEAALSCTRCGVEVELWWWTEASANAQLRPLALGAIEALGPSFSESYAVWYRLCARATIGNAAFEAGESVTRTRTVTRTAVGAVTASETAAASVRPAAVVTVPVVAASEEAAAGAVARAAAAAAAVAAAAAARAAAAETATAAATTTAASATAVGTTVATAAAAEAVAVYAPPCFHVNATPLMVVSPMVATATTAASASIPVAAAIVRHADCGGSTLTSSELRWTLEELVDSVMPPVDDSFDGAARCSSSLLVPAQESQETEVMDDFFDDEDLVSVCGVEIMESSLLGGVASHSAFVLPADVVQILPGNGDGEIAIGSGGGSGGGSGSGSGVACRIAGRKRQRATNLKECPCNKSAIEGAGNIQWSRLETEIQDCIAVAAPLGGRPKPADMQAALCAAGVHARKKAVEAMLGWAKWPWAKHTVAQ